MENYWLILGLGEGAIGIEGIGHRSARLDQNIASTDMVGLLTLSL